MSAPTTPACPLGLRADDLSAWRDHALPAAAAERISAHLSDAHGCPACQRLIAAHEALAAAAQAERPPAPDPRAWPQLQARIAASQHGHAPASPALGRARHPAVWGGLGAAAAVLLLSALFIHLFAQQALVRGGSSHVATATATPVVTPQPIPTHVAPTIPIAGTPLNWQTREGPADLLPMTSSSDLVHSNEMVFSPTDAHTAYVCSLTRGATAATVEVWASHDGARSWTHVNTSTHSLQWYSCKLNVDAGDPMRVELTLVTLYGNTDSTSQSYLSDDGGVTWRHILDVQMLTNLVTRDNDSVGMIRQWPPYLNDSETRATSTTQLKRIEQVVVSHDDWRTWQPIDSFFWARGLMVKDVWQRPGDGALLASAMPWTGPVNSPADMAQLWQSIDLGAHWTRIPTPTNLRADGGFLVGQPQANDPWHACGIMFVGKEVNQPTTLVACTRDSGQTWQTRPMPVFMPCGNYCEGSELSQRPELLPDGSLLAPFSANVTFSGPQPSGSTGDLYLLAPDATHWKDIGSAAGGGAIVIGGSTTTLVSLPNIGYWQVPTDELGEPFGVFFGGDSFAVATLP